MKGVNGDEDEEEDEGEDEKADWSRCADVDIAILVWMGKK